MFVCPFQCEGRFHCVCLCVTLTMPVCDSPMSTFVCLNECVFLYVLCSILHSVCVYSHIVCVFLSVSVSLSVFVCVCVSLSMHG